MYSEYDRHGGRYLLPKSLHLQTKGPVITCPYCHQPTTKPYKGVAHTECYREHKRLEWKQASPTKKKEIETDMAFISLIERTFT